MSDIPTIEPTRENLHGAFSKLIPSILTVRSGDSVRFRTIDVGWGLEGPTDEVSPRKKIEPRGGDKDNGPAMCGPIAIEEASPGSTLEIRIKTVTPGSWGFTWTGNFGFNNKLNEAMGVDKDAMHLTRWDIDAERLHATNQFGHRVCLSPFLGTLGLCPDVEEFHPGWFPHAGGGNMDCKEITAGSTLYLPVAVEGALVSLGDGHAVQGHGEVSGMALECPMEDVVLQFIVRDDFPIDTPHVLNEKGWSTLGFSKDLDEAIGQAMTAMLNFIMKEYSVSRNEATALASLCVDLHITQLVNDVRGVHALLPHNAIQTT